MFIIASGVCAACKIYANLFQYQLYRILIEFSNSKKFQPMLKNLNFKKYFWLDHQIFLLLLASNNIIILYKEKSSKLKYLKIYEPELLVQRSENFSWRKDREL